jgi:hypothetical protein
MGAKFYFFTDPAPLSTQAASQAYGPAGTQGGNDRFRVTDLHQRNVGSTADVPAFAVCRGRIAVQAVRNSANQIQSLNLILQPLDRPPFDFPYIEYFIYRNINFSSLVNLSGDIDLGNEGLAPNQNDLIAYIRGKVLKLAAASSSTAEGKYLGLDRVHDASADGGKFGDPKPIDHLFRYSNGAELPIVQAGWKLADFSTGSEFGIEVVVQTYGAQPKLEWARRDATALIEVGTLAAGATNNDKYRNRLARETIGCFVDPCAFWGMFFDNGLSFRTPAVPADDRKLLKGKPLCDKLFTGSLFKNCDRIYLNVRNETGYSYNFYGNYEDPNGKSLQIGSDSNNLVADNYDVGGWPIYFKDGLAGNKLCFKLCSDNVAPLLFLHQTGSSSPGGKRFKEPGDLLDNSNLGWTTPTTFTCPEESGVRPPWCFVAHYLRVQDGSTVSASPIGVFDTAPLQFGPIGDRVIAGHGQLWPPGATVSGPATKTYERSLVADKVLRYDGAMKTDPVDPTRSLSYERVGETIYILQKGVATNAGKDSVTILQRRQYQRRPNSSGSWNTTKSAEAMAAGQGLLFKLLAGAPLSTPISRTLNVVPGPLAVTVPTFEELQSDTAVKTELFDFTFLCLSKTVFDPAVAAANPISPDPATGEKHAIFLTLTAPTSPPALYSTYDVAWHGWDGPDVVPLPAGASTPIYSADGVFFSSSDFDSGSLSDLAAAYTMTPEEEWLSRQWDDVIAKDQMGSVESDRMRALVDDFSLAILDVSTTATNPKADLLALVETYAPQIWDRAVLLVKDTVSADSQEWSDLILFCARAKMEVALKNHAYVLTNLEDERELTQRFEERSRNFVNLDFSGANAAKKQVILTGFDPYAAADSTRTLATNPSGKLALYLADSQDHSYSGANSFHNKLYVRTCVFPVRWKDFDERVVETVIGNAIMQTSANVAIVCTCSLEPNIEAVLDINNIAQVRFNIDQFAGKCRDGEDNNNFPPPTIDGKIKISDATLPDGSDKKPFYVSKLKVGPGPLSHYDALTVKLRYNETFSYNFISSISGPLNFSNTQDDAGIFSTTFLSTAWPIAISQAVADWAADHDSVVVLEGSGANYLSNEIFYRVSNLVQSSYSSTNVKYTSLKNGHIHLPNFKSDIAGHLGSVTVTVDNLATSVLAVLDGTLGP